MKRFVALAVSLLLGCSSGSPRRHPDAAPDDEPSTGGSPGSGGMVTTGGGGAPGTGGTTGSGDSTGGTPGGSPDGAVVAPKDSGADAYVPGPPDDAGIPTGNPFVYVSGLSETVHVYRLDMMTGTMMPLSTAVGHVNIPPGMWPTYMAWDPAAKHMYAVQENNPGRIIAYDIDQTTGALTRTNEVASGGNFPTRLTVHRSGKWVV